MKKVRLIVPLFLLSLGGCAVLNSQTAPEELKNAAAVNAAVAGEVLNRIRTMDGDQIETYLTNNKAAWEQMDQYFNGK